ncbi:hypothetical protein ACFSW8_10315 [Rubritalea tangerina]|uniref:Tetratricopeptide repeat protein n=2 Tax=Rubritalea tangerina TaxID=430798 RepID=A0ABW4ZCF0_9BACT
MSNNDTFDFFHSDPLIRAQDLLQESRPKDSHLKKRSLAKRSLEISSQCLDAWLLLLSTYSQFPQSRDACIEALTIAESLYPSPRPTTDTYSPNELAMLEIYKHLGTLYYNQEDYTEAIQWLKKGLDHDPADPRQLRSVLVLCYLYANKHDDAERLCHHEAFEKSLSSRVSQAYLHFLKELPDWTPDQMDEIPELLFGRSLWQWMHERSNSMKRHFRAINHANPFFAAFMLNPECHAIELPTDRPARHAAEALEVAQLHQALWSEEELPMKLLEEYPWENPIKKEIIAADKPLLKKTIKLLESHRDQRRSEAERAHLEDHFY